MKEINDEIKIEKFEDFYQWLKKDGLIAKRSERLLRKTIFRNLLGCHEKTIENFQDFLEEEEEKMKRKEAFENNKFAGKSILTASGFLIIETAYEIEEGIMVRYQNDSHSIFKNIEALEKVVQ